VRVLVADDILTNRTLTARILEKRGHFVKTVDNGKAAVEQLEKEDFDIVLMDVHMPVMDGIEATRIIRNHASLVRRHDVPIVAVSAAVGGDGKKLCLEAGMCGYLSKPLRTDEFVEAVERHAFKAP
jgi:CheY-like chemotaxis protein